jgi:phosphatidylinositol alpha-mannosyltransferase
MSPTIIPNGLDVPAYHQAVEKNPYRVVFLGRSEPRKGLAVLLAAWPRIHNAFPSAELMVLGATAVDGNGVTFKGRVFDEVKQRELAGSSIYVAPNLGGESFLITLIEGMAAGCALVATDLPAFRDVADEAAVYFERGNPEALARAVMKLMAEPSEIHRLRSAAEARVGRYDWSVVMPRYLEAYEAAIGAHRRHG